MAKLLMATLDQMDSAKALASRFEQRFGRMPRVFRAPGRVNLIGEHTDYNDGFVMPVAIPLATRVAIAPTAGRAVTVYSENFAESATLDLDDSDPRPRGNWSDYVRGVIVMLDRTCGDLQGANLLMAGDVPLGSGLSSSAALEVAVATALLANSGHAMDKTNIARLCQRAENEFAGARCGIMDQFASCQARANHAILLDCRSVEARYLALPDNLALVVCNTMVKHAHSAGEYNRRREECELAVRTLSRFRADIIALRDATLDDLAQFGAALDPTILRRARHVVTENARALDAAAALDREDAVGFGRLMGESHRSLRDDFEVSCAELDAMVDFASRIEGVYGSRMTGGGFGGCTVSLVDRGRAEAVAAKIFESYLTYTGIRCECYVFRAAEGAAEESNVSSVRLQGR